MPYQFSDMGLEEYGTINLKQRFKGGFCEYVTIEI